MDQSNGRDIITGHQDVFGVPTTNTLVNVLDVASHYPYNPERWRLEVDGSRVFPEYGSVTQYNHAGPHHELKPGDDETVVMKTAERPRYAVGFEQLFSFAFSLSRSLESGDQLRVGPYDDNDGWFIEHNPEHNDDQVNLVVREGDSDSDGATNAPLNQPVTTFERYELRSAWYRISRQLWRQSVEVNDNQENENIGRTSKTDGGPEVGNLPLRFEITRGSGNSAITLKAGSVSLLTQGDRTSIRRAKTHEVVYTTSSSAASSGFVPQYAMRIDPDRKIVDVQITNIEVMEYGGADDVTMLLQAHDLSKVNETSDNSQLDEADFSAPVEHNAQNSALEEIDPSSFTLSAADSTGSLTSDADNPGGYQVGYGSLYSSGSGSKTEKQVAGVNQKRGIYAGDIIVLWSNADDNDVSVTVRITTEQDW